MMDRSNTLVRHYSAFVSLLLSAAPFASILTTQAVVAQVPNIHGQTNPAASYRTTTDMTPGTLAFADFKNPGSILLRLTLPRAYVWSHYPTGADGNQYVIMPMTYPDLEPWSVASKRADVWWPQSRPVDPDRLSRLMRSGISISASNTYRLPFHEDQRRRIAACRSEPIGPRIMEIRREARSQPNDAECRALFQNAPYKTSRMFFLETDALPLLIACKADVDPQQFHKNCQLHFVFRGFDWKLSFQSQRLDQAFSIHAAVIGVLDSHVDQRAK